MKQVEVLPSKNQALYANKTVRLAMLKITVSAPLNFCHVATYTNWLDSGSSDKHATKYSQSYVFYLKN